MRFGVPWWTAETRKKVPALTKETNNCILDVSFGGWLYAVKELTNQITLKILLDKN